MTDITHVGQGDPQTRSFKQIGTTAAGDPILAEYIALEPGSIGGGGGGVAGSVTIADGTTATQKAAVDVTGRLKVDGSSVTQPVSGTFWQATQPVSGAVSITNFPVTQPVSGTFFQATQPVSEAALDAAIQTQGSPVPASSVIAGIRNSAGNTDRIQGLSDNVDGVSVTAAGNVVRVWAEGVVFNGTTWDRTPGDKTNGVKIQSAQIPAALAASGGLKVDLSVTGANATALKVDGSAVTQPVSGTFWQATQPVSGAVTVSNFPATQPVSGTFFQATQPVSGTVAISNFPATQPVSGTVTANQGGAPWSENITQVGGVAVAATAKGTQGANLIPTQDAKDAGRTAVTLFLDAVAGITTEALGTMSITKGGVVQTAATAYTVTAGKTLRISGLHTSVKNTSTVASDSRVRVRQAAAVLVSSPVILINEAGTPAAVATAVGTDDTVMPDGYEVAGGQQIGISHLESATTCTVSVMVVGYEY